MTAVCSIDGCGRSCYARGWCERHYHRWKTYGDPLGGGPARPAPSLEEQRERLAHGLDQIRNPVALATRYLASRRLLGGRDEDDLLDVAIQSICDAAVAWDPEAGRSMLSWAWLYMDRNVTRELGRCIRQRALLGEHHCLTDDGDWLRFEHSTGPYERAELRIDLQRWADLGELTPLMRFVVEYAALHKGTYVRDTPYAGAPTPLTGSGSSVLKNALAHMRQAAVTGQRRDDKWTRMRGNRAAAEARSNRLLEELRATEDQRDRQVAS